MTFFVNIVWSDGRTTNTTCNSAGRDTEQDAWCRATAKCERIVREDGRTALFAAITEPDGPTRFVVVPKPDPRL